MACSLQAIQGRERVPFADESNKTCSEITKFPVIFNSLAAQALGHQACYD